MKSPILFIHSLFFMAISSCSPLVLKNPSLGAHTKHEGIYLGDLGQKQQYDQIIAYVEDKLSHGDKGTTEQLFWLCDAYASLCNYEMLLLRVKDLEKSYDAGDRYFVGNDIAVYPYIYRSHYYLDIGNYSAAIGEAQAGYELLHRDGRPQQSFYRHQLIELLGVTGTAGALSGEYSQSREMVRKIAAISTGQSILGPEKHIAMARIHMANRDYEEAMRSITHPEARVPSDYRQLYNTTFQDLPKNFIYYKCLLELGRIADAKTGYDALLNHPQISQLGGIYWILMLDRARIYRIEENTGQSVSMLIKAAEFTEQVRSTIQTEAGRIGFVEDKQMIYQELISQLMEQEKTEEALHFVERSKARALMDLLGSAGSFSTGDAPATDPARVLKEDPELEEMVTVTPAGVLTIRSLLHEDECLIEYYYTKEMLHIFVADRERVRSNTIKIQSIHLERTIYDYRNRISSRHPDAFPDRAAYLYDLLIRPVEPFLNHRNLVIVPHGTLHYLPFITLHSGDSYMLETHTVRYLPCADMLRFLAQRENKVLTRGLILGNPDLGDPAYSLEFAEKEANLIKEEMPYAILRTGEEATETLVKNEGAGFDFLHFANHGIFDPDHPLLSSLLLAPDDQNDGRLTASEIYTLSMKAGLITLSACESGLGKISGGDDLIGFTRGLFYAGVHSIVSSLWKVDDRSTSDLMVAFYKNLKEMPKHEALRMAQLETMKKYPHPYYWAPFILTGKRD